MTPDQGLLAVVHQFRNLFASFLNGSSALLALFRQAHSRHRKQCAIGQRPRFHGVLVFDERRQNKSPVIKTQV